MFFKSYVPFLYILSLIFVFFFLYFKAIAFLNNLLWLIIFCTSVQVRSFIHERYCFFLSCELILKCCMKIAFSVFKSIALNYSYQIYQKIGQKWKSLWLVLGNATFLAQTLLYFWVFLHFKTRAITQKLNEKFHLTHRQNAAYYA